MGVPPGNRPAVSRDWVRGVPERYVAGADTRGRQEGRPYPWSQHVIHEISGLEQICQLGILTPKVMERRSIVICSAFFSSEPQPLQS